jgi:hypothetical protein
MVQKKEGFVKVRCNKTDQCTGRYRYPGKKQDQICHHYGEHEFIGSGTSQPRVACPKADHCPLHNKEAWCDPAKE